MEIEVQLFASLRLYLPPGTKGFTCRMQLDGPMTVRDFLSARLKMPEEAIKTIMLVMVNGDHASLEHILSEGDILVAVPIATGG